MLAGALAARASPLLERASLPTSRRTLPSGARLTLVRDGEARLVGVCSRFAAGLRHEADASPGAAIVLARALRAMPEARALEARGVAVTVEATRDALDLCGEGPPAELGALVGLGAAAVTHAAALQPFVASARALAVADLPAPSNDARAARLALAGAQPLEHEPTAAQVETTTVDAVLTLARLRVSAATLHVAAAGALPADAEGVAAAALERLAPTPAPPPVEGAEVPMQSSPRSTFRREPGPWSTVVLAWVGPGIDQPERAATEVLVALLAGSPSSRLGRLAHGPRASLAAASGSLAAWEGAAPLTLTLGGADGVMVADLLRLAEPEIRLLANAEASEAEVRAAVAGLSTALVADSSTPLGLARHSLASRAEGDVDPVAHSLASLAAVTPRDVRDAAKALAWSKRSVVEVHSPASAAGSGGANPSAGTAASAPSGKPPPAPSGKPPPAKLAPLAKPAPGKRR